MIFETENQNQRLKWAFSSCKNGAWGEEPDSERDAICIRAADFNGQLGRLNNGERTLRSVDQKTFKKIALCNGDIIIEKSGGGEKQLVGRAAIFHGDQPSFTSNFLARCRPAEGIEPEYLNYLLLAIYNGRGTYPHLKQSTGIQNLDLRSFLDIKVNIPTLETQYRIAQFLNEKTARIDNLIEKKRALLDRLAEKRQALITQAVTKGLETDAPMRHSGVDWLSEIPAHWDVIALNKVTTKITNGYVGPTRDIFHSEGIRYIQSLHIKNNRIIFKDDFFVDEDWSNKHSKSILRLGDVLVVQTGYIGQVAHVTEEFVGCNCHALIICRPDPEMIIGEYLSWVYCSDYGQQFLHLVKTGALHPHLNCGNVKFFPVIIPPLEEQKAIAENLAVSIETHRDIESRISESIRGLQEYRSALITAAVTGQSEVT